MSFALRHELARPKANFTAVEGEFALELIESLSQVNALVVQVAFSEPARKHTLQLCGSSFVKAGV